MSTVPLTTLDEAFLNLDDKVAWSVQFELQLPGALATDRLHAALRQAVAQHPILRAHLVQPSSTRWAWEIGDEPDHLPLEVIKAQTSDAVEAVRRRLQRTAPSLDASPPFALTQVQTDAGDLLMLNLHHVAGDGMSAVRLMRSLARAYNGEDDPQPDLPIEKARDLREIAGSKNPLDLLKRVGVLLDDLAERRGALARIAPQEGGGDGFVFQTLHFGPDEAKQILAHKQPGSTVNDVLIAGLTLAIRRWNAAHGDTDPQRVSVMMPVNLRPAEWWTETISNFASYLAISLPAEVASEMKDATNAIATRTTRLKEQQAAGWIVDILEPGNALPVAIKRRLQGLLPVVQGRYIETTVLSNLGRLDFPAFDGAGAPTAVWFTPPCFGPLAVAVGAGTLGKDMFLTLRCLRSAFDEAAAQEFAALYAEVLKS